ncbi:MAG TPA: hypothetical protein VE135_20625 [Pyrinomonadaceae bacterium]|nr:hypothetical protein [Pyrinomonadaceae bacterium]
MQPRYSLAKAAVLLCWMVSASTAAAQITTAGRSKESNKSVNYGFVSPNTSNDLKLEDAIKNLSSSAEANLIRKTSDLGCRMRKRVRIWKAVGSWSDGAEHSILLRMDADESTMRYLVARLGRDAHQKAVLYFHRRRGGPATLYILYPGQEMRGLRTLAMGLDHAGVSFRTLVPLKRTTVIYVVDTKGELGPRLRVAAKRLRATVVSQEGNAEFIGDEVDQGKGDAAFKKEIVKYEAAHPPLPATCQKIKQKRQN